MAHHLDIGNLGESIARDYLISKGYEILETNWRFGRAEIDIIARKDGILIIIEVKSRSDNKFGKPESSISEKKRMLLADAATRYMEAINHEWEIRFDVIALIIKSPEVYTLDHYPDSFFPGW